MPEVRLTVPTYDDLGYIDSLWRDESTMAPVGGPIFHDTSEMNAWFRRMIYPGSPTHRYFLIVTDDFSRVGEASFHRYDPQTKTATLNIKVDSRYRRKGIAQNALTQLLAFFFGPFGGTIMKDPVGSKNLGGQHLLERYGFRIVERAETEVVYELTRQEFSRLYDIQQ